MRGEVMESTKNKPEVLGEHAANAFLDVDISKDSESLSDTGSTADVEDDTYLERGSVKKKYRKRRKKVYFRTDFQENESESSLDESADESLLHQQKNKIKDINPSELNWLLWFWFYICFISTTTLHVAEYCGEKLADFFGITAPKYQYAINEYYRLKEEEEAEQRALEREEEHVRREEAKRAALLERGEESGKIQKL